MVHVEELGLGDPRRADALGMVLSRHIENRRQVRDAVSAFTQTARRQGLGMDRLLLAVEANKPVGACLALESPGSSALIMCSPVDGDSQLPIGVQLLERMQDICWQDSLRLLQSLIRPEDGGDAKALSAARFRFLAELDYMECPVSRQTASSCQPGMKIRPYEKETHELFLRCLEASYADTLDCPGLMGIRSSEDILSGHRATGLHDPKLWYAVTIDEDPAGILLLSRVANRRALEVVYVGVSKTHRGRGLGDRLLALAFQRAQFFKMREITLAVDNTNRPAAKLYERWGFCRVGSRRAWIAVNRS